MPASVSLCFIPDSMAEQSLKDKTAKGLLWGGISNGVQQLLNLAFGIFLARILTPADYGMVGMLAIFTAIAGTLQDSGFTSALANKKEVTHRDYNAVFWFSFLTGITLYIILFFSAPLIAAYYRQPDLIPLARFTFLGFVISSSATAHSADSGTGHIGNNRYPYGIQRHVLLGYCYPKSGIHSNHQSLLLVFLTVAAYFPPGFPPVERDVRIQ